MDACATAGHRRRLVRAVLAPLLLIAAIALGAAPAGAQIFLATRPNPEFEVGPLFIRASVGPELGPVAIDILWSLAVPPTRSALGLEQDLYLLWPAALQGEERTAEDEAVRGIPPGAAASRSSAGASSPCTSRTFIRLPDSKATDRRIGAAPFVSFRHVGLETLGVEPTASIVRIPWTPDLVNRVRIVKLRLLLDGAIGPSPRAGWKRSSGASARCSH